VPSHLVVHRSHLHGHLSFVVMDPWIGRNLQFEKYWLASSYHNDILHYIHKLSDDMMYIMERQLNNRVYLVKQCAKLLIPMKTQALVTTHYHQSINQSIHCCLVTCMMDDIIAFRTVVASMSLPPPKDIIISWNEDQEGILSFAHCRVYFCHIIIVALAHN
jgi:hypothetical protein